MLAIVFSGMFGRDELAWRKPLTPELHIYPVDSYHSLDGEHGTNDVKN